MPKNIIIATGGTGGHVYPAMALAQQLLKDIPDIRILFLGGGLGKNRYFDRASFDYQAIPCGTFVNKSPKALFGALGSIIRGIWQSYRIIRKFQPDMVVGFGSYFSFPPMVAAKMRSVYMIVHEANSIPGRVNRLLAPWADVAAVHFPETLHLLKGNALEVGMPLRSGFQKASVSQDQARLHYGLHSDRPTLLVFGGSQGARSINGLIRHALEQLPHVRQLQVLHITGDSQIVGELQDAYQRLGIKACVKPFEERMDLAWQAATMVISRAGAGTIAEQLEFEVPGILIPYPYAADNHQEHNADFMVATVGGAVKLHEKGLTAERLAACLEEFIIDEEVLQDMRKAMTTYKKRARSKDLCSLVKEHLE